MHNSHFFCPEGIHAMTGDFNTHYEHLERIITKGNELLKANKLDQFVSEPTHTANGILNQSKNINIALIKLFVKYKKNKEVITTQH